MRKQTVSRSAAGARAAAVRRHAGYFALAFARIGPPSGGGASTKYGHVVNALGLLLPLFRIWIFMIISCYRLKNCADRAGLP
jgi:hypothetical protein